VAAVRAAIRNSAANQPQLNISPDYVPYHALLIGTPGQVANVPDRNGPGGPPRKRSWSLLRVQLIT
jgi:hypothetical protein